MPFDRWRESGSDATPAARHLLASASIDDPSQEQLASLAGRLAPMLDPFRPPLRVAPQASGLGARVARSAVVLIIGAAVLGVHLWKTPGLGRYPGTRPGTEAANSPLPSIDRVVVTPALLRLESYAEREPGGKSFGPAPRVPPPSPVDPSKNEALLLLLAHEALVAGDVNAALAKVAEHQQSFPKGALAEEREVLAIEALAKSGQADGARARARSFHARYPSSAYAARVDAAAKDRADHEAD
jgi:hypothetical protein